MNRDTLSKSPLFFFLVGYAILKDFSYLFGAKFYRWRHDNWPIRQWVTFHAAPDTAYVNNFFPTCICNMIHIHSGETGRPQDIVARSFASRPHALKLASLTFRTYKESTCSTSRTGSEGRELEVGNKNCHTTGDGSASTKEITSSPWLSHFFRVNRKSLGDEVAKNISFVSNRFTLGV